MLMHEADITDDRKTSIIGFEDFLNLSDGKGISIGMSKSFAAEDIDYLNRQSMFLTNECPSATQKTKRMEQCSSHTHAKANRALV